MKWFVTDVLNALLTRYVWCLITRQPFTAVDFVGALYIFAVFRYLREVKGWGIRLSDEP